MTQLHYRIGARGLEEKSFCNVSEFIDCDTALASRYSHFTTRIGVILNSELGILYYLLLFAGFLYAAFSSHSQATLAFIFASTLFAFAYSLVMAYLSIFTLGVICLLCLTTYLCNLLLFLLLPRALQIGYRDIPSFFVRYIKSIFVKTDFHPRLPFHLAIAILFFFVGLTFFRGLNPSIHRAYAEVPRQDYLKAFYALPQKEIPLPANRPIWGNPQGKVTIVDYSDFQCPFCRRAAFTLKPYLKEFRDKIRLVYMNFPLDNSCNPAITQPMHPTSCLAAKAALCAHAQGKFWEYHDKIFENQKGLSWATLVRLAGETGMEASGFEKCIASDTTANLLKEDIDLGGKLEIHGTPSLYINGRLFSDWPQPERLRMVIESELKNSR